MPLQVGLLLVAWIYLFSLHPANDGLWFQGDAPRHAANGLFWKDFLQNPSLNFKEYALAYYARYPVISPTAYPPVFYLLEGLLFSLFGPSPYVAKGLVLAFAMLAGLYTMAWLRRWVAKEAGAGAALVLLLPGVVPWSHAIMLNVPAFALSLGALYHSRRWLEAPFSSPDWRHIYPAAALSVLAILTYIPAAVIIFIAMGWLIAGRRWDLLCRRSTILVGLTCLLLLLPWMVVAFEWAPTQVNFITQAAATAWNISEWTYYPAHLNELFNPHLIGLAGIGVAAGLLNRGWRSEIAILLIWLGVTYAVFTLISTKDTRYLLPLSAPLVCLCMIAVLSIIQWVASCLKREANVLQPAFLTAVLVLLAIQAVVSLTEPVRSIHGFKEVVVFLRNVAPAEPVFYDGCYDGIFTFYLRADDPGYRRRVVLGNKLLYASAVMSRWQLREFVSSQAEVLEELRKRGGCRWLVIENSDLSDQIQAARLLRETVHGPEFELARSFPIDCPGIVRLDVYRFRIPIQSPDDIDLPFPTLGTEAHFRVKPIQPPEEGFP